MKAYLFGNFEEQLSFDILTDDEVIEVLNDINNSLGHTTKASFSNVELKDDSQDPSKDKCPDECSLDISREVTVATAQQNLTFKGNFS